MDESSAREATKDHQRLIATVNAVVAIGVMVAAESEMRRVYWQHVGRMWIMRAVVLLNVATMAWDWADAQEWVRWVSVLPMWGAWYAFRAGERFAGDLRWMRTALADAREKIRTAKRLANES